MKKTKYDLIFSCGEFCMVSKNLRDNKLQFESYPFDWILGFSPIILLENLKDNFKNYFLKENLVKIKEETEFDIYEDKTNKVQYLHDFHHGLNFDEDYNENNAKFQRRIKRLQNRIENSKKMLLIFASSDFFNEEKVIESFRGLKAYIKKDIDFLYVRLKQDMKSVKEVELEGCIRMIDIPYNLEHGWMSSQDKWKKILSGYYINGFKKEKRKYYRTKLKIVLARVLASFMPIKKYRKIIRQKVVKKLVDEPLYSR